MVYECFQLGRTVSVPPHVLFTANSFIYMILLKCSVGLMRVSAITNQKMWHLFLLLMLIVQGTGSMLPSKKSVTLFQLLIFEALKIGLLIRV